MVNASGTKHNDDQMVVFDRRQVHSHRERAAPNFHNNYDFLIREVGDRLVTRLDDVKRPFHRVLDLGCHTGQLAPLLQARCANEIMIQADLSRAMVSRTLGHHRIVLDEEFLPFSDQSLDLVVSSLSLHWINDLPGTLLQIARLLKPDGLLLAAMLGGETLLELRTAFLEAEAVCENGARPHVSPFADVQDLGGLLQRAGFALPVVDADCITVTYENAFALMRELRAMGETNAAVGRNLHFARRETFFRVAEYYQDMF